MKRHWLTLNIEVLVSGDSDVGSNNKWTPLTLSVPSFLS